MNRKKKHMAAPKFGSSCRCKRRQKHWQPHNCSNCRFMNRKKNIWQPENLALVVVVGADKNIGSPTTGTVLVEIIGLRHLVEEGDGGRVVGLGVAAAPAVDLDVGLGGLQAHGVEPLPGLQGLANVLQHGGLVGTVGNAAAL